MSVVPATLIKPCPFCHGVGRYRGDYMTIQCEDCLVSGPQHLPNAHNRRQRCVSKADAVAAWNNRSKVGGDATENSDV